MTHQNRFECRQNAPFTVLVFIFSLQFHIVSNTIRMHHLPSLFSFFLCNSISFKIPSECTIYRPCFHFFSASPYRFKYRKNAPFTVLVYIFFLQFHIVSNTVRMHHLPSLFSFFLCNSISFQIPWEYTLYRLCLHNLLCISKSFQMPLECLISSIFHFRLLTDAYIR